MNIVYALSIKANGMLDNNSTEITDDKATILKAFGDCLESDKKDIIECINNGIEEESSIKSAVYDFVSVKEWEANANEMKHYTHSDGNDEYETYISIVDLEKNSHTILQPLYSTQLPLLEVEE